MADSSTFPTTIDAASDLKSLVPIDAAPTAFQDWAQLLSDAVSKIEILLGTTASPQGNPQPYCEISDSAVSVANNTNTVIGTTATETVDTHNYHSDVTNRSRLTVPSGLGGTHMTFGRTSFAYDATGHRRTNIMKNNDGTHITIMQVDAVTTVGATTVISNFWVGRLSAGDYVESTVLQNSGSAMNVTMSVFGIVRLGP